MSDRDASPLHASGGANRDEPHDLCGTPASNPTPTPLEPEAPTSWDEPDLFEAAS